MQKQTPTPPRFFPLLFHLHIQYLLLHHRLFGENYIVYNVFIAKNDCVAITIALKIELFYIYFSRILATGAEQLFC